MYINDHLKFLCSELDRQKGLERLLFPDLGSFQIRQIETVRQALSALEQNSIREQSRWISEPSHFTIEAAVQLEKFQPLKEMQQAITMLTPALPSVSGDRWELKNAISIADSRILDVAAALGRSLDDRASTLTDAIVNDNLRCICERIDFVSRTNFGLPSTAFKSWSMEVFAKRLPLLKDSLLNIAALEHFETEAVFEYRPSSAARIEIAAELVSSHSAFVHRLPPPVIGGEPERDNERGEELGPRLEAKLAEIDPRLAEMRRTAWKNFAAGKSGARLAAHGIREIFGDILRRFAPDDKVEQAELWINRKDKGLPKPTRRMRFEFIVGAQAESLESLIQFDESIQHANRFAHVFAEEVEVVRAYLAQLEACIYLVLTYALDVENGNPGTDGT